MAKASPLTQSLREELLTYGYSRDDIDETLRVLASKDELHVEFENGNIVVALVDRWLRAKGYRFTSEDFDVSTIPQYCVEEFATFIYEHALDISKEDAIKWVEAAIKHVVSPSYWKYAKIVGGILWDIHIDLNFEDFPIPFAVVQQALSDSYRRHWGNDPDALVKLLEARYS